MVDITPFLHFKQKLQLRHGVNMTKEEHAQIVKMIRANPSKYRYRSKFVHETATRVGVRFPFKGKDIICVYSKKRKGLITVVSKDS